ncbi:hypothetical protein [Dolichospermum compactum]|uniref:Uncharacterized protein n=1 Tax=Dolichospermum compactum NIES-806 TaxID=1973481 RepID=A0A1Z4V515_9CYAN|nr:hypothetical protein [Dolichospermum compactum]BAZ86534.1 hypothetical protein NIES806_27470 [Dolichospermum compactum NIES-806]
MSLTVKELEEIQIAYPDYPMELVDGTPRKNFYGLRHAISQL